MVRVIQVGTSIKVRHVDKHSRSSLKSREATEVSVRQFKTASVANLSGSPHLSEQDV